MGSAKIIKGKVHRLRSVHDIFGYISCEEMPSFHEELTPISVPVNFQQVPPEFLQVCQLEVIFTGEVYQSLQVFC